MANVVKVPRNDAVALFEALGLKSASKWNAVRMAAKLSKINEMVDDDTNLTDAKCNATLTICLEAIKKGSEITVTAPTTTAAPASNTTEQPQNEDTEQDEATPDTTTATPDTTTATTASGKKGKQGKKPAAPKPEKAPGIPGVREMRTRPFLAGVIIKKHGMAAGITDAMVAELDKEYGKANPPESLFTLRNAWHAVRGFNAEA